MNKGASRSWVTGLALAVMIVTALTGPVAAQDDLTWLYADELISFSYPDAWYVSIKSDAPNIVWLSNSAVAFISLDPGADEVILLVITPEFFEDAGVDNTTMEGALEAFIEDVAADPSSVEVVVQIEVGERTMLRSEVETKGGPTLALALELSDGTVAVVSATTGGDIDDFETVVLAIAETVDRPTGVDNPLSVMMGSGEPCMVSSEARYGAPMRVGPGENRTELTALPANEWFPVTGQATDDAGLKWWQLDKWEVAPNSSAAELWVRQDQVETQGDCDQVIDANAPPLIPITAP